MSDNRNSNDNLYEQQEQRLQSQSEAFLSLLTRRGLLEDPQISDDKVRQAAKAKKRNMYHNTKLMLKHYRDISWALECFPSDVAAELDRPLGDLDALISLINSELGMNNVKLEIRAVV